MNEILLEQGTQEWLDFRSNRIGASDVAPILGLSPYTTRLGLWKEKMGICPPKHESYAMKYGKENEVWVRSQMNVLLECNFEPKCFVDEVNDWLMCSVDGIDVEKGVIIEIKCANQEDHDLACRKIVPTKYIPQLQTIMYVCDVGKIWYCSYHKQDLQYFCVPRSYAYLDEMIPKLKDFWESLQNFEKPEITDEHKEFTKEEIQYEERSDRKWWELALAWTLNQKQKKKIEEEEKELKQEIINLSQEKNVKGYGLKLTKRERKGSIDYLSVVELQGIDLEKYRKETTSYWEVRNE